MNTLLLDKSKFGLLALRGTSILAKFGFTALYFRYSEAAFGEYSLVATTILLLVFVLGLDFYSYANRSVLESGTNTQRIIFNQFSLYLVLYVVLFPLVYLIFRLENFSQSYLWLFYFVLISEHLNFEFYRLLFIFKKPFAANINLFLRNGLWVIFAVWQLYRYQSIDIETVLWYWLAGNLLALLYFLIISLGKRQKIDLENFKWDKQWIVKGLIVSVPYILGTVSYKTIEFADRYMIDYFLDRKAVGVYSFFANMANVLNIVLFTVVISVLYPLLVEAILNKNTGKFQEIFSRFRKEIYFYSIAMAVILSILLPILLIWIGKDAYLKQFYVFLLLIAGNFLLNLSFLYHYIIYAHRQDWKIFKATFLGALLNVILNIILIPLIGISGAAVATLISFAVILWSKKRDSSV